MSFKSRFEKPPVEKPVPAPAPAPESLPMGTQRELEELSRRKVTPIRSEIADQDQRRPDDHRGGQGDHRGRPLVDHEAVDDHESVVDHKKNDKSHCPSRTERDKIGLRLPRHKVRRYKMYAWEHKIPLQDLVEIALDRLLDDHNFVVDHAGVDDHRGRPQHDRSDHDHEDLKDRSVDDHKFTQAMGYYRYWTGNQVTRNDEISFGTVERFELIDIKIGILQAVKNAKTPVRMFSYCCTVIKNNARQAKPRFKQNKFELLKELEYEIEKKREGAL